MQRQFFFLLVFALLLSCSCALFSALRYFMLQLWWIKRIFLIGSHMLFPFPTLSLIVCIRHSTSMMRFLRDVTMHVQQWMETISDWMRFRPACCYYFIKKCSRQCCSLSHRTCKLNNVAGMDTIHRTFFRCIENVSFSQAQESVGNFSDSFSRP